ncbi:MAG: AraC family transcriptional regulator [Oscillospiraceae bacterium]
MQYLDFKESLKRGVSGFPIELYPIDKRHPQYVMSCHWHLEYEIIRVLEGSFACVVDGKSWTICPGEVVFINGGSLHAGVSADCRYECVVFDLGMLMKQGDACHSILDEFSTRRWMVKPSFKKEDGEVYRLLNLLFDTLGHKAPGYQLVTEGLLFQIFGKIVAGGHRSRSKGEAPATSRKTQQLKKALHLIETSYANAITLEELAQAAGMTPKYFCHFFQRMTQRTPIDYLNYHRIEVSCFLLMTGDYTTTEVAYECGFNDLSYFIRVFKKYKGTTPKQYLRRLAVAA